ncbi:hypothetical protein [Streptomyces sp. bgisy084]|uniref:hypothetical protein n=1 Tax=Streptomyces sp. bgisy084 TaxID=3413777 RepID=UPI003D744058
MVLFCRISADMPALTVLPTTVARPQHVGQGPPDVPAPGCGRQTGEAVGARPHDGEKAAARTWLDRSRRLVAGCLRRSGDLVPWLTTEQAVRDMDLFRALLGVRNLSPGFAATFFSVTCNDTPWRGDLGYWIRRSAEDTAAHHSPGRANSPTRRPARPGRCPPHPEYASPARACRPR